MAMKVEKQSSKFIKPFYPTPSNLGRYRLGFADEIAPLETIGVVLFFSPNSNHDTKFVAQLEKSLEKILTHLYPLAGRYVDDVDQTVECNDEGAHFIYAIVNIKLYEFLGLKEKFKMADEFIPLIYSPGWDVWGCGIRVVIALSVVYVLWTFCLIRKWRWGYGSDRDLALGHYGGSDSRWGGKMGIRKRNEVEARGKEKNLAMSLDSNKERHYENRRKEEEIGDVEGHEGYRANAGEIVCFAEKKANLSGRKWVGGGREIRERRGIRGLVVKGGVNRGSGMGENEAAEDSVKRKSYGRGEKFEMEVRMEMGCDWGAVRKSYWGEDKMKDAEGRGAGGNRWKDGVEDRRGEKERGGDAVELREDVMVDVVLEGMRSMSKGNVGRMMIGEMSIRLEWEEERKKRVGEEKIKVQHDGKVFVGGILVERNGFGKEGKEANRICMNEYEWKKGLMRMAWRED
ncbi:transferase, chloramphenicol acetyltransferase-like domain protein [Tanacetum coccineum]